MTFRVSLAQTESEDAAKKIYRILTGGFLQKSDAQYGVFVTLVNQGRLVEAAQKMTENPNFTGIVVRNWGANLLTRNTEPLLELNDSLAFIVGSTRDNINAKSLLTANYIYGINPKFGLGRPLLDKNLDFEFVDQSFRELKAVLHPYSPQWDLEHSQDPAGVLTTRWWASKNYSAGTNRRAVVATLETFLCQPNTAWKKPNLPTTRIRQDIDRFPAGNAQTFQKECRSCHSIMDGLAGAFAKIDYANDALGWSTSVQPKFLQNSEIYPDGYVTKDSQWINLIADDSGTWGWKTVKTGVGIQQLGSMLANSSAFANCLTKTVTKSLCKKDFTSFSKEIKELSDSWANSGLKLKDLFVQVATSKHCL